jgi:hypothetical protein
VAAPPLAAPAPRPAPPAPAPKPVVPAPAPVAAKPAAPVVESRPAAKAPAPTTAASLATPPPLNSPAPPPATVDVAAVLDSALNAFLMSDHKKAKKMVEKVLAVEPGNKKALELMKILGALP